MNSLVAQSGAAVQTSLILLACLTPGGGELYLQRSVPVNQPAQRSIPRLGLIRCGIACARWADCIHWHASGADDLCRLWSLADGTGTPQTVYEAEAPPTTTTTSTTTVPTTTTTVVTTTVKSLPACYDQRVDGTAFCLTAGPTVPLGQVPGLCAQQHAEATPAYPDTPGKQQLLVSMVSGRTWLGMIVGGGTSTDSNGQRSQAVPTSWMYNQQPPGDGCMRVQPSGLISGPCHMGSYPYICEVAL